MFGDFPGPVVVGVDDSPGAIPAVRWAAREAARLHRPLRVVHATEEILLGAPRPYRDVGEVREMVRIHGHRLLQAAGRAVREEVGEIGPRLILRGERRARALLDEAADACLLVLATPGIRPMGRVFAGSVSIALSAHVRCPLAIVRGHVAEDSPPEDGPVVVGVDGSPASEAALALAFEEASWRQAPLTAVHCWEDRFLAAVREEKRLTLHSPAVAEHEHEVLGQRLAGWREKYPDVPVNREVVRGRAAERLLDFTDRARMLVVGNRGHGGVAGLLLGSTCQAVMSYALCPVLVARDKG